MVYDGYTTIEVKQETLDKFREAVYSYHGGKSHGKIKLELDIALRHRIEALRQNSKIVNIENKIHEGD